MKRIAWIVCVVAACTGSTGPQGPSGPQGTSGTDGTNGTNGSNGADGQNGSNGNDIIISDRAKHGLDISPVAIDTTGMTSAQIEAVGQGSYLVNALADCGSCHGEAGTTPGFLAGTASQTGTVFARNLTPYSATHTTGMQLTADQFVDVMRRGTNYVCSAGTCASNGTDALATFMPWQDYRWASDSDLRAVYAYLQAIPAVDNQVHADGTGVYGTLAAAPTTYVENQALHPALPIEFDTDNQPVPDPDFVRRGLVIQPVAPVSSTDATTEAAIGRGSYLVNSFGRCNACHTSTPRIGGLINATNWMTGGVVKKPPAGTEAQNGVFHSSSANLVGAANGFFAGAPGPDFATFSGILSTGLHIDDTDAMPLAYPMPWRHIRELTLSDQAAVYTFLQAVQAAGSVTGNDKADVMADYYCTGDANCSAGSTCDLTTTNATYHHCVGMTCSTNADCPACQTCDTTTTHTCNALSTTGGC